VNRGKRLRKRDYRTWREEMNNLLETMASTRVASEQSGIKKLTTPALHPEAASIRSTNADRQMLQARIVPSSTPWSFPPK